MKTIDIQILDGNLTNEDDPTREQVSDYVEMVRSAVSEIAPGAEIEIDLQHASGCTRVVHAYGYDEDPDVYGIEYEVSDLMNKVHADWAEKHNLA